MSFTPTEIWDGQTCYHCGKEVRHETYVMDDNYFCSDHCFGAYLIEKHEEDYEMVDFWTEGEMLERQREDHDDQEKDYYEFFDRH